MSEKFIELVFILDKSGSMHGQEKDVVGGFNAMIDKQKKEKGRTLVTTVLFSIGSELLHARKSLHEITEMSIDDYGPSGCTALFDAIGDTVEYVKSAQKDARFEGVPTKTIVVVTTDGLENSSCKYNYSRIKEMIKKQEKSGWEFLFVSESLNENESAEMTKMANDMGFNSFRLMPSEEKRVDYYAKFLSEEISNRRKI